MSMDKIIKLHTSSEEEAIMIKNMRAEIEREKVLQTYNKMIDERKVRESLTLDPDKSYEEGSLTAKNNKFQEIMRKKLPFINDTISQITCVAANTLYLIGAQTGGGKSTTVANIVIPILKAKKKILVISNEEPRNQVFTRIACRMLSRSYLRWTRNEYPDDILNAINEECERLAKTMTVVGTDYQKGNAKYVTTPEGLEIVFKAHAADHDVILIDYFQAISHSVSNPDPQVWVHQEKFCNFLNTFKDTFDGPVFVMSQLWPAKKKDTHDFLERIKGRKAIGDITMVHMEVIPNKETYTSEFVIHKDRLWNNDGVRILMGYDRESGNFVNYDDSFKIRALKWSTERSSIGAVEGSDDANVVDADDRPEDMEKAISEVENELNLTND